MRLLLDTRVYVWWRMARSNLSSHAQAVIESEEDVAVSAVSAMELAVKQALGKLVDEAGLLDDPADHDLRSLPLTWAHPRELRKVPLLHRDPFDRLLVAQARVEDRTLVTADDQLRAYDVATMPA